MRDRDHTLAKYQLVVEVKVGLHEEDGLEFIDKGNAHNLLKHHREAVAPSVRWATSTGNEGNLLCQEA